MATLSRFLAEKGLIRRLSRNGSMTSWNPCGHPVRPDPQRKGSRKLGPFNRTQRFTHTCDRGHARSPPTSMEVLHRVQDNGTVQSLGERNSVRHICRRPISNDAAVPRQSLQRALPSDEKSMEQRMCKAANLVSSDRPLYYDAMRLDEERRFLSSINIAHQRICRTFWACRCNVQVHRPLKQCCSHIVCW